MKMTDKEVRITDLQMTLIDDPDREDIEDELRDFWYESGDLKMFIQALGWDLNLLGYYEEVKEVRGSFLNSLEDVADAIRKGEYREALALNRRIRYSENSEKGVRQQYILDCYRAIAPQRVYKRIEAYRK